MAAKRPIRGAAQEQPLEATVETAPAVQTTDAGLVKWLLVGTTISLVLANVLLWVVELGKYKA